MARGSGGRIGTEGAPALDTHLSARVLLALRPPSALGGMMVTTLEPARTWLAEQIRSRVVGDNPEQKAAQIFDATGSRWFPENSPIRIVHADASMFIGGLRALLLQSLHPLAMAGVADHSDYKGDPWGRLQRTSYFLAVTTFGTAHDAARAVSRVRAIHDRISGTAPD